MTLGEPRFHSRMSKKRSWQGSCFERGRERQNRSGQKNFVEIETHIDRRDLIELELFRRLRSGPQRFRRLALALIPAVVVIGALAWWFVPVTTRVVFIPVLLLTIPL